MPTEKIEDRSLPIRQALREKGYRVYHTITPKERDTYTREFIVYGKGTSLIMVQCYSDGGCEVWKPLVDSNSVEETLDALPN